MGRLEGKVIVLTAAAQGIGRASALVSSFLLLFTVQVLRCAVWGQGCFVLSTVLCFFPLFFMFAWFLVFETGSLYIALVVQELTMKTMLTSNTQGCNCLCVLSAGTKCGPPPHPAYGYF